MGQARTQSLERADWYPLARRANFVTTESGSDLLVYDRDTDQIHHLDGTCAAVWNLCDGTHTEREITSGLGLPIDTVRLALGSLARANLLDGPIPPGMLAPRASRRSFLRKAAITGGVALPTIVSITAPQAAAAYSEGSEYCTENGLYPLGTGCYNNDQCCSQYCELPGPFLMGNCAPPPPV